MNKNLLSILTIFFFYLNLNAQEKKEIIQDYLNSVAEESEIKLEDVSNWEITDSHVDRRNGIEFVYIRQVVNGIPLQNGLANFALKNGEIKHMASRLKSDLKKDLPSATPSINAVSAINAAAVELNISAPSGISLIREESIRKFIYSKGDISLENIPVELVYIMAEDGKIHLAWELSIYELSAENWWSVTIDANNGEMINKVNWVNHCEFGHAHGENEMTHVGDQTLYNSITSQNNKLTGPEYRVYALPTESPNHGPYVLLPDPGDSLASPFGWHDTDGVAGAEYTITRGNNVHAYEDQDGTNANNPGLSPDGTAALHFDFPYTPGTAPSSYIEAATTNLFYLNNEMHDIWYHYGFDEASGNFQVNNYGRGGIGGDDVRAEAQDGGGTNNANFATPSDGSRPRMQMYLWGSGNSARDGDFDNGIIAHEYGHGISNRLTGGASNTGCLNTQSHPEQMGEGWSDWFGLMITIDTNDLPGDRRGIATFSVNQSTNGTGIRPAPYSKDFANNNFTYGNTNNSALSAPHGVGFVFATALWDMTWDLINLYGGVPDPDIYNGTGGNNIAMDLVMTGLKLQPCGPGMLDGRDAILAADSLLYNGMHQCLIWDAFANRGFGFFANQGSDGSRFDQTEDFTPAPYCQTATAAPIANFGVDQTDPACGVNLTFIDSSLNIAQQWFWDFGDGNFSSDPRPGHKYQAAGTYNAKLVVSNNIGSDSVTKTITIGSPEPPIVIDQEKCNGGNVLLVATNEIGTPQWFDVNNNLVGTGLIYLATNVSSNLEFYVRNVPNGTNSMCFSDFDTANITFLASNFSYNQSGPTVNFIDSSSNATSWTWSFGDGNTSTLQNPSHTYLNGGNYNVRLAINGTPCAKTENISIISGIEDESLSGMVSIHPNPAKDYLIIDLEEIENDPITVRVESMQGAILDEFIIKSGQSSLRINTSKYASSMYLLRLNNGSSQTVQKFIKEN